MRAGLCGGREQNVRAQIPPAGHTQNDLIGAVGPRGSAPGPAPGGEAGPMVILGGNTKARP